MPDDTRSDRRRLARALGCAGVGVAGAVYLPAVAVLGQWVPVSALPADVCRWRGPATSRAVAVTFDDGPHPEATPAVLDRLDALGIRASFFPLASVAERHPDLVAEVVRRGHLVGTHGYRHGHHLVHGLRWVRRDLDAAGSVMGRLGLTPRWYRPAFGQVTAATLAVARAKGWKTVLWSAWGREWATADPGAVGQRIIGRLSPGAIVLLHDSDAFGPKGMWRTGLEALERVGETMEAQSLAGVTLDELVP
jgi:peptidoglycan-N-acetylglucosamine deacetylase